MGSTCERTPSSTHSNSRPLGCPARAREESVARSWPLAACRAWHGKWLRAPFCSSHGTRLLSHRLPGPRAAAPASTLNSPPLAMAAGWGIIKTRGVKLQKTPGGQAGRHRPAPLSCLALPGWRRSPWGLLRSDGAALETEATQTVGASLRSPAPLPRPESLLSVVCRAGRLGRV